MLRAGIDIGSRTVKLVVVKDNDIVFTGIEENSYDPLAVCGKLLDKTDYNRITATGYGRHLFKNYYSCDVISEIKAFTVGIGILNPSCRTILDIGGQDTKAISINEIGGFGKFVMNDKCAAGTGKFLEVMATALGLKMNEFIEAALSTGKSENINSMCTVFAESEVISMISRGADRPAISLGIHKAIIKRAVSLINQVKVIDDIAFVGGVANNVCIKQLLSQELGKEIFVPDNPQLVGALGCVYS